MTDSKQLIERIRAHPADAAASLKIQEAKITDLEARLRLAEKRAEDAEARNDFLIGEIDKLREKARQS